MWVLGFCVNLGVISLLYKICIEGRSEFWSGGENYLDYLKTIGYKDIMANSGGRASAKDVAALYSPVDPGELKQARRHNNILGKLDQRKDPDISLQIYAWGNIFTHPCQTNYQINLPKATAVNQWIAQPGYIKN